MHGRDWVRVCPWVEEVTIDPVGGIVTPLDNGDAFKHSVADVFTDLCVPPLISVLYRVVVGVGWVVFEPVMKKRVIRWVIFFITVCLIGGSHPN
jgi:hypothetical protein